MKQIILSTLGLIIVALAIGLAINYNKPAPEKPVACTMEAMICPDGSYVGRTGPKCEFATCPNASSTNTVPTPDKVTVVGRVTISPTCPVERTPPDPACAPKGYATTVNVYASKSTKVFKSTPSRSDGSFTILLPYNTYRFEAVSGNTFPHCSPTTVTLENGGSPNVNISCDSGIR